MANDRLGDGPVVQGMLDVIVTHSLNGWIKDRQVDQYILLIVYFLLLDANKSAQTQILDTDTRHSGLKSWHLAASSNQLEKFVSSVAGLAEGAKHYR